MVAPVIFKLPLIVWLPWNVLDPVVAPPTNVPLIDPKTVKLPVTVKLPDIFAEDETERDPVIIGSNIFIFSLYYTYINTTILLFGTTKIKTKSYQFPL